ncbi:hypothetical protein ACFE04_021021 [Oxalis oulophora]
MIIISGTITASVTLVNPLAIVAQTFIYLKHGDFVARFTTLMLLQKSAWRTCGGIRSVGVEELFFDEDFSVQLRQASYLPFACRRYVNNLDPNGKTNQDQGWLE